MKKSIIRQSPKRENKRKQSRKRQPELTIGLDLGDKKSRYCILDSYGEIVKEDSVSTTQSGMRELFSRVPRCRLALEVGTHSRWGKHHMNTATANR